jgi:carbon-monoxide dehydrogenase medium subunit
MWQIYHAPASLDGALHQLAEYGPEARIVAGGTDLLVELRRGVRGVSVLVDATRIGSPYALDRVHRDSSGNGGDHELIHIGPAVTHNQAVAAPILRDYGFPLALSCWEVGTPQLRNRGTIAGNLVTASPANDTITTLWALDARLTMKSVRGERTLSFDEFYKGVRRTELAPDEMVVDVAFPALSPNQRGTFTKLGLRRSHAIAVVNAAAVLTFNDDMTVSRARITLGSVAPTIIRTLEAERSLIGETLNAEAVAAAAALAQEAATPIDDIRGGALYRAKMVRVLVRRALEALVNRSERSGFPAAPPMLWGRSDGHFQPLPGKPVEHRTDGTEPIQCTINGTPVEVQGANDLTLLDMLREHVPAAVTMHDAVLATAVPSIPSSRAGTGLTGSKEGCAEGECGACTVWMDGIAVLACLVPAPRAHGTHITTVEGLANGEQLHPVQQAFINEGAVQCGYCTPGFIMSGANLLEEMSNPTQEQITAGLHGNLCRCTGYYKIVQAIEKAAQQRG